MYIAILVFLIVLLAYFALRAARSGGLDRGESLIFGIISALFAGYLIFIVYKLI